MQKLNEANYNEQSTQLSNLISKMDHKSESEKSSITLKKDKESFIIAHLSNL